MIMSICLGQLPLLTMVESDVKLLNLSSLNVLSYNCRGFNEFKIPYIQSLMCRSDVLFIQEHWLSDGQLPILNNLSTSHCSFSVCGFNSDEVLQGRPYGGCAIPSCGGRVSVMILSFSILGVDVCVLYVVHSTLVM